ncbi:MAG TPA: glycosyltransferase family 39 protein [Chloroflexia bacterium]|nr:glycosyltransferase family 39 protein [Chloroflexia bacterium]
MLDLRARQVMRFAPPLVLGLLLLAAFYLRASGHNWDQGHNLHPDEPFVVRTGMQHVNWPQDVTLSALLDPARSPINVRGNGLVYSYGTFPLYSLRLVTVVAHGLTGNDYFSEYFGVAQTGRVLTALFDALTVLAIFGVGARLWGRWIGLLCASLYAFAVLPIQIAHIFGNEPYMALFVTLSLFCSVLVAQTGKRRYALLGGVAAGLALACKLSALPMLMLPLAGALVWCLKSGDRRGVRAVLQPRLFVMGALALAGAFLGLFLTDPYAVLDLPTYWSQVQFQADIQRGAIDMVYTRQFIGTWPVLYPWLQVMLVGVNPIVGVAGTLGLVALVWRVLRQRLLVEGLVLVGFVAYFAPVAISEARWMRYYVAAIPYLCLFAGAFVVWLWDLSSRRGPAFPAQRVLAATAGLLVVSAMLGAAAYTSIYRTEHTEVQASRWMYDHVPRGSRVGAMGDTVLPLPIDGKPPPDEAFSRTWYDLLGDKPSEIASREVRDFLRQLDYLTVPGIKVLSTVKPLPWRYPVQRRYHELLFSGQLGFEQIYKVTSYPRLFGLEVVDSQPPFEPNFVEYDHHPVWVFRKVRDLSDAEWDALFAEAVKQPSIATRQTP